MEMEGINWDEVNAQAAKIRTCLQEFNETIASDSQAFINELANFWASGNAVTFNQELGNAVKDIALEITSSYDTLADLIVHAAKIYASQFNVPCNVYTGNMIYSSLTSGLDSILKEVNNGITGMNKAQASDCVEKYKNDIQNAIDAVNSELGNIHISIFDSASIQKDAFDQKIKLLLNSITNKINNTLTTVEKSKNEEIDRLELAKNQTTNTFNA